MRINRSMIAFGVVAAMTAVPAFAGAPAAAPGPLIGAGIPALAGLAYVYSRFRKKRDAE